jgi:hypothetical protein
MPMLIGTLLKVSLEPVVLSPRAGVPDRNSYHLVPPRKGIGSSARR